MNRIIYFLFILAFFGLSSDGFAGNPDRQGEAGAPELLMNPWARSAGLHTMTTSMISGVEALRLNPAGLARINRTEIVISSALYLRGTDINMNAVGLAQRVGKSGAFGLSLMALDLGDIPVTTTSQPEGNGSTFSPRIFNIGLSYANVFENKVSVGATFRAVSQSISNASASAVALDAGVQYVTGEQDNFKFGISLRNVGSRMQFKGEGLDFDTEVKEGAGTYGILTSQRQDDFELQSVLNIGGSYDFYFGTNARLTVVGNYTSNAFSQDQIGGGLEFSFNDLVMVRGGYKLDFGQTANSGLEEPLYTGPSAGVTLNVPVSKSEGAPRIGIDYAYRATKIFDGTHNFSIRISI
ncbi:MAG: DUF3308 domain-containing protein [Bacteroidetes bacterium]|nr:MAG: DUF3308 domain-containing protein [Bacteroidota bacterium]